MKISFNWLKEFVDCPLGPEELAERLTMAGLEAESVTRVAPSFRGIVAGKVLSVAPHPGADRLTVCRVSDGAREFTVVCGAKNVRAGMLSPLARPGAALPDGTVITEARLRGIVSEGMLCSERELELGQDAAGIMILPGETVPGADLSAALGLEDAVLDINVPPNRPDCLSVIGIAREAAAILGARVAPARVRVAEKGAPVKKFVRVKVEDARLCPRYSARLLTGVSVGPSPFRIRHRLGLAGLRTVNNVVDATNYVLAECGQPMHAFDFERIAGGAIAVRTARAGETITTIDGVPRPLGEGMLVIADARGPVAVAGIMGGSESAIGGGARSVLLESACFNPQSVRRTSAKLGLASESSYRFERGTDVSGTVPALNSAAALVLDLAGGEACRGVIDCARGEVRPRKIVLRMPRLNAVLGTRISRREAAECCERLCIKARARGRNALEVVPPTRRVDLDREADLIEEVARLRGYRKIEPSAPRGYAAARAGGSSEAGRERVRDILTGLGFDETINLSFMGAAEMDRLTWGADEKLRRAVAMRNPVSAELSFLRTSMLPSIMRCLALNAGRGNRDARIFEMGTVFSPSEKGRQPLEREGLAVAVAGLRGPSNWCTPHMQADFFYLKGVLETLLAETGSALSSRPAGLPSCRPGRAAALFLDGTAWGWLGEIHPRVAEAHGIKEPVIMAEIDGPALYKALCGKAAYRPLPRRHAVRRDIAVVADEALEASAIIECARGAVPALVEHVDLFDLFRGEPIPGDKKGLALALTLRSPGATLREEEIEAAMQTVAGALREIGCEIR